MCQFPSSIGSIQHLSAGFYFYPDQIGQIGSPGGPSSNPESQVSAVTVSAEDQEQAIGAKLSMKFARAASHPGLSKAIEIEKTQFKEQRVLTGVPADAVPAHVKLIHGIWLFSTKWDVFTHQLIYKARMVLLGQHESLAAIDTISPTLQQYTFRVFLSVVQQHSNWLLFGADIKTAFLAAEATRDIYISRPPGFESIFPHHKVLKLQKQSYGLKDSPLRFFETLRDHLLSLAGIQVNAHDQCAYHYIDPVTSELQGTIITYVDDILYAGIEGFCSLFLNHLQAKFTVKYTQNPEAFLGYEIGRTSDGHIKLSQQGYIQELVQKLQWEEAVARSTEVPAPLTTPCSWIEDQLDTKPVAKRDIQVLIGALIWTSTHCFPQVAHLLSHYSRLEPTELLLHLLKWLVRYLYHHRKSGIWFPRAIPNETPSPRPKPQMFTDASLSTTNSFIGCAIYVGHQLIHWKATRQQPYIHGSTHEAEFAAIHSFSKVFLHICGIYYSMIGLAEEQLPYPMTCYIDNLPLLKTLSSVKQLEEIPSKMPKINQMRYWIQTAKFIQLQHFPGIHNPSDLFTKLLSRDKIQHYLTLLGVGQDYIPFDLSKFVADVTSNSGDSA